MIADTFRRRNLSGIGPLEAAVLSTVWSFENDDERRGGVTVREIYEDQAENGVYHAYTTIMSVANNLVRKGLLAVSRDSIAYRYRSVDDRDQICRTVLLEVVNGMCGGSPNYARDLLDNVVVCEECGKAFLLTEDMHPVSYDEGCPVYDCADCLGVTR